jgi:hypothetical protein
MYENRPKRDFTPILQGLASTRLLLALDRYLAWCVVPDCPMPARLGPTIPQTPAFRIWASSASRHLGTYFTDRTEHMLVDADLWEHLLKLSTSMTRGIVVRLTKILGSNHLGSGYITFWS